MKRTTLNIEESKFKAFLSFIKTLDHVYVDKEEAIPQWQQVVVKERVDLIEKGEMKTRCWEEAKEEVFKRNELFSFDLCSC